MEDEEWRMLTSMDLAQVEVSSEGKVRIREQNGYFNVIPYTRDGKLCVEFILPNGRYYAGDIFWLIYRAFYRNHKRGVVVRPRNANWMDPRLENVDLIYNGKRIHYRDGYIRTVDTRRNGPIEVVETGEVYQTATEVAQAVGGDRTNISMCLAGKLKSHKGFTYRYV